MKSEHKQFSYGIGASAVLAVSIGLMAILYGLGLLPLNFYYVLAWIFGPLGVYTVVYTLAAGSESTYYLVWGTVMVAIAIVSAFYNVIAPILVLGVLVIVLAVIGIVAYMRGRK